MINVDEMIKEEEIKLKESNVNSNGKSLNYLASIKVYKYLRYELDKKTKVMSYEEYSDYMRLESSILFTDLKYSGRRTLRNGYDHLYNEFQDLFRSLDRKEISDICSKCLEFSKDITRFEELNEYLKYEPVKTYIRFIANRYKPVLINYSKYDLVSYCNEVLNKCKKINKGRV